MQYEDRNFVQYDAGMSVVTVTVGPKRYLFASRRAARRFIMRRLFGSVNA